MGGGRGRRDVREEEARRKVFCANRSDAFKTIFEDGYKILHGTDLNENDAFRKKKRIMHG